MVFKRIKPKNFLKSYIELYKKVYYITNGIKINKENLFYLFYLVLQRCKIMVSEEFEGSGYSLFKFDHLIVSKSRMPTVNS
jgi:hypothetical protein